MSSSSLLFECVFLVFILFFIDQLHYSYRPPAPSWINNTIEAHRIHPPPYAAVPCRSASLISVELAPTFGVYRFVNWRVEKNSLCHLSVCVWHLCRAQSASAEMYTSSPPTTKLTVSLALRSYKWIFVLLIVYLVHSFSFSRKYGETCLRRTLA